MYLNQQQMKMQLSNSKGGKKHSGLHCELKLEFTTDFCYFYKKRRNYSIYFFSNQNNCYFQEEKIKSSYLLEKTKISSLL